MKLYLSMHDCHSVRAKVEAKNETCWLDLTVVDPSGNTESISLFASSRMREVYFRALAQAINQTPLKMITGELDAQ